MHFDLHMNLMKHHFLSISSQEAERLKFYLTQVLKQSIQEFTLQL